MRNDRLIINNPNSEEQTYIMVKTAFFRCRAETKDGRLCARKVHKVGNHCHQHQISKPILDSLSANPLGKAKKFSNSVERSKPIHSTLIADHIDKPLMHTVQSAPWNWDWEPLREPQEILQEENVVKRPKTSLNQLERTANMPPLEMVVSNQPYFMRDVRDSLTDVLSHYWTL